MRVYDWNDSDQIALVEPGRYVRMDSFDVSQLTPVHECYLKQYHYVACVKDFVVGMFIMGRLPYVKDRWHGGVRPWEVDGYFDQRKECV